MRQHPPAQNLATQAQNAAQSPPRGVQSQAQAHQVNRMGAQQPQGFDKERFKARLRTRIQAILPRNPEQADNFTSSGGANQVRQNAQREVGQGQQTAGGAISSATRAEPSTEGIQQRQAQSLPPGTPTPNPLIAGVEDAVPQPRPQSETNLQGNPRRMDEALGQQGIPQSSLERSNEPQFLQTVQARQNLGQHSNQAPRDFRRREELIRRQAGANNRTQVNRGMRDMTGTHARTQEQIRQAQGGTRGRDEAQRRRIATQLESIYTETRTQVTTILNGLASRVDALFNQHEQAARSLMMRHAATRLEAYKRQRYAGVRGFLRSLGDALTSLPPEVNAFYLEAGRLYTERMDQGLDEIAELVATSLNQAKSLVDQGKLRVNRYVASLPRNLRRLGRQAARTINSRFDSLNSEISAKETALINHLAQSHNNARQAAQSQLNLLRTANQGLLQVGMNLLRRTIGVILEWKNKLMNILREVSGVVMQIIREPIAFFRTLIRGLLQGFVKFGRNILGHLRRGLITWLTGAMGDITMPDNWDLKGVFSLVGQVLGLSWANIKAKAVVVFGQPVVTLFEMGTRVITALTARRSNPNQAGENQNQAPENQNQEPETQNQAGENQNQAGENQNHAPENQNHAPENQNHAAENQNQAPGPQNQEGGNDTLGVLAQAMTPEQMQRFTQGMTAITAIRTGGLSGLWGVIKPQLANLKEMVIGRIKQMIITQVIQAGLGWLTTFLGGVATAFLRALQLIHKVVQFFIQQGPRIIAFVRQLYSALREAAQGKTTVVASLVERGLGMIVPVLIDLLARVLGIDGLATRVRGLVQRIRTRIDGVILRVFNAIKRPLAPVFRLIGGGVSRVRGRVRQARGRLSRARRNVQSRARAAGARMRRGANRAGSRMRRGASRIRNRARQRMNRARARMRRRTNRLRRRGRNAAGRVLRWWRDRIPFRFGRRRHRLGYTGQRGRLAIFSSTVVLAPYFQRARTAITGKVGERADLTKVREARRALGVARTKVRRADRLRTRINRVRAGQRNADSLRRTRYNILDRHLKSMRGDLGRLASKLEALGIDPETLQSQTVRLPQSSYRSRTQYPVSHGGETVNLGKKSTGFLTRRKSNGSDAGGSNWLWRKIRTTRNHGYSRGHLIGRQFGGSGRDWTNLTPLHLANCNQPMAREAENPLAAKVTNNRVFSYEVNVHYGRPSIPEDQPDFYQQYLAREIVVKWKEMQPKNNTVDTTRTGNWKELRGSTQEKPFTNPLPNPGAPRYVVLSSADASAIAPHMNNDTTVADQFILVRPQNIRSKNTVLDYIRRAVATVYPNETEDKFEEIKSSLSDAYGKREIKYFTR